MSDALDLDGWPDGNWQSNARSLNPQTSSPRALGVPGTYGRKPSDELGDVLTALEGVPKRLPSRLLYDEVGCRLFERTCETVEHYSTRIETALLQTHALEMVSDVGAGATLVEWGNGASTKTQILLASLMAPRVYVPVDSSREMLMQSSRDMKRTNPQLDVRPLVAEHLGALQLPLSEPERTRPIVTLLLGSMLGKVEPDAAVEFLATVRQAGGKRQRFILGTDLPKAASVLEAAYDDASGTTSRFNHNILNVVNRRFQGTFDPDVFAHRAIYNAEERRIEMRLVSRETHTVTVSGRRFAFAAGESIVTEHCYKFSLAELNEMAGRAGFDVLRVWTDNDDRFAVQLWAPS